MGSHSISTRGRIITKDNYCVARTVSDADRIGLLRLLTDGWVIICATGAEMEIEYVLRKAS